MKISNHIKEFCQDRFLEYGMIGPLLLCRKFKIKLEEARKILEFLKYPKNVVKKKKVDSFTLWCEARGLPTRKPRGKKALDMSVEGPNLSHSIRRRCRI